ncbi:MAG: hypothetical protein WC755_06395 [Candidatus Woesearchaeota archaeon]|jgi:hypothetical protein
MTSTKEFAESAFKFTHNPLGIIGLFIVLLYGFASLVIIFSNQLNVEQRWPLILFLVIFPVAILISFLILVIFHHSKLYGPTDFRDDGSFIKLASPEEQKRRNNDTENKINTTNITTDLRKNTTTHGIMFSKANMKTIILNEELILREIENETNLFIKRNVKFAIDDNNFFLDGVMENNREFVLIEAKFTRISPESKIFENVLVRRIENFIQKASNVSSYLKNKNIIANSIIFAVATEKDVSETVMSNINNKINSSSIKILLKFYNIKKLQEKFGV